MAELNQQINQQITEVKPAPAWVYNDGNKTRIDQIKMVKHILAKNPVKAVKDGSDYSYYIYNGINWEQSSYNGALKHVQPIVMDMLNKQSLYTFKAMNEISRAVLIKSTSDASLFADQPTNLVAFKNGTFELDTGTLRPNHSFDGILNGHDYEADLDGTAHEINEYGKYMFGNSWTYMKELIGYAFIPDRSAIQVITILLDTVGGTGKSKFLLNIVRPLIGKPNISDNSILDLTGKNGNANRFASSNLVGKLLNMHPDLNDEYVDQPDYLKQLSGGDWIRTESKGKDAGSSKNYALFLFASNHDLRIKLDSALLQRMNIVPVIAPRARNVSAEIAHRRTVWDDSKLEGELGAFAVECLKLGYKAYKRQSLTVNDEIKKRTALWASEQDRVGMFIEEATESTEQGSNSGATKKYTHDIYTLWCEKNGFEPYKIATFNKEMEKHGCTSKRLRDHPETPDVESYAMSWLGLSANPFFDFKDGQEK